jgi:hypothetical protein
MIRLDKRKVYNHLCTRTLSWKAPKSWAHFLIRKITKSPIDHVGFIYHKHGRWMQAEATTGKAKVLTLQEWLLISKMDSWIQEDNYATLKREQMIAYAEEAHGKLKYDFLGLVWMAIYIRRNIWLGRKRNQDERQFCSEFYANAKGLQRAQYKTPKDIMLGGSIVLGKLHGYSFGEPVIDPSIKIKR